MLTLSFLSFFLFYRTSFESSTVFPSLILSIDEIDAEEMQNQAPKYKIGKCPLI